MTSRMFERMMVVPSAFILIGSMFGVVGAVDNGLAITPQMGCKLLPFNVTRSDI